MRSLTSLHRSPVCQCIAFELHLFRDSVHTYSIVLVASMYYTILMQMLFSVHKYIQSLVFFLERSMSLHLLICMYFIIWMCACLFFRRVFVGFSSRAKFAVSNYLDCA